MTATVTVLSAGSLNPAATPAQPAGRSADATAPGAFARELEQAQATAQPAATASARPAGQAARAATSRSTAPGSETTRARGAASTTAADDLADPAASAAAGDASAAEPTPTDPRQTANIRRLHGGKAMLGPGLQQAPGAGPGFDAAASPDGDDKASGDGPRRRRTSPVKEPEAANQAAVPITTALQPQPAEAAGLALPASGDAAAVEPDDAAGRVVTGDDAVTAGPVVQTTGTTPPWPADGAGPGTTIVSKAPSVGARGKSADGATGSVEPGRRGDAVLPAMERQAAPAAGDDPAAVRPDAPARAPLMVHATANYHDAQDRLRIASAAAPEPTSATPEVPTATGSGPQEAAPSTPAPAPASTLPFAAELARAGQASSAPAAPAQSPTAAELQLPTPVHDPDFVPRLSGTLALLARDGVQEARVQVHPVELGPISVQITLDGATAQVHLVVDSATTRQLLEQAMPTLAAALRENGLTLTGGGVFQQARQNPRDAADGASGRGTPGARRGGSADADPGIAPVLARRSHHLGVLDAYA